MPTHAAFVPSAAALPVASSSLLATTPPTVAKALSQVYPFLAAADYVLSLLTWTNEDPYQSFLLLVGWSILVRYFEIIVLYLGQATAAAGVVLFVLVSRRKISALEEHPSLDIIVHELSNLSSRLNLFLIPLTSINFTHSDLTRLFLTALFASPLYITLAVFFLGARNVVLFAGLFVLSYHSLWARVTRAILWRWNLVRALVFYLTGVDFNKTTSPTRRAVAADTLAGDGSSALVAAGAGAKNMTEQAGQRHIRFTYVLFENQRRWLGIGWTGNMLAYERAPWTDEFLNESSNPDVFTLPDSEGTGMQWRWVDKTWKADLSCDGALVPKSKVKFTPDPGEDDGYVYSDNLWRRPSAEYSYSKYTRRRRWIRTAELVTEDDETEPIESANVSFATKSASPEPASSSADGEQGSTSVETPVPQDIRQRKPA